MDVVLVGLPGSGKSAIGRRLAHRHDAAYVDLDETIEREAGVSVPEIFATEGEEGFRARERQAVAALGPADPAAIVRRVIATGGGAIVDPRNRWLLYRGRLPIWLDGRPEVLAQRLRRSPNVRPLVTGRDPIGSVRALAIARERFYAAANRVNGVAEVGSVIDTVDSLVNDAIARFDPASAGSGTTLIRIDTRLGRIEIGEGIAVAAIDDNLRRLEARRAVLVSEPGAWAAAGERIQAALADLGWTVEHVFLPQGEAAKRFAVVEDGARELARLRVERREPMIAIGGGALGDSAGFLAATYLRGIPVVHVPTTLVAQIDSSIGGKTAVDLPEGKNLVGAFHQPAAVVIDVSLLRTLPPRQLRAALGEAVKMGALGDDRLLELLDDEGLAIGEGRPEPFETGAVAELVERAAWAKVEVVLADERESGKRRILNLGHSLGHAFEAAGGFEELLHGEAVAYGLRAAVRIGNELGITPDDRRERIEGLLTQLGLAVDPLPYDLAGVRTALGRDKKHAAGRLHWVLPTADGVTITDDVPDDLVDRVAAGLLARSGVPA
jgi:shikimate kinase/3-dehydroquinate synthase